MPPNERLAVLAHDLSQIGFTLPRFGIGDVVTFAKLNDGPGGLLVVMAVRRLFGGYPERDDGEWVFLQWQYLTWYPSESKRPEHRIYQHGGFAEWGWIDESRLRSHAAEEVEREYAVVGGEAGAA